MKVWLLTNTPSPYQVEFFSAVARSGACELSVRFMRMTHRGENLLQDADAGFEYRELRGIGPRWWSDAFRFHPAALREMFDRQYGFFILSGQYTSLTFVACAALLTLLRRPWAMWLEKPWPEDYRPSWSTARASIRSPVARVVRRGLLKGLLRMARGVFCIGTDAMEAYRDMGAPGSKLHFLPYYCDVERFARVDPRDAARIRARLGFMEKTVFLYSGSLIERKGVDLLLEAFQKLAAQRPEIALIILGEGPMAEKLQCNVHQGFAKQVHFAGHVPQADLPAWLAASDVFVFPSRYDGWGVVLNEACGAGLPIISTDAVGAARDLVRDKENGKLIPRDDAPRLAAAMLSFVEQPDMIKAFGKRSQAIAADFTLARGIQQLLSNATATLHSQ